ncbi:hypothetical protein ISS30_04650 [bacterium]|nr:hypothetical protein [bacterium]
MKRQEYLARFFGDMAKIIFGTIVISQLFKESPDLTVLIEGFGFLIGFLVSCQGIIIV